MDERRKVLIERARALYDSDNLDAHAFLRVDVLNASLTPAKVLSESKRLARNFDKAADDPARARASAARAEFREWVRCQAAAEQGQPFRQAPGAKVVDKQKG